MATQTTKRFWRVDCPPECGFSVRSHDEKELIGFVVEHARGIHGSTISERDVRGLIKPA